MLITKLSQKLSIGWPARMNEHPRTHGPTWTKSLRQSPTTARLTIQGRGKRTWQLYERKGSSSLLKILLNPQNREKFPLLYTLKTSQKLRGFKKDAMLKQGDEQIISARRYSLYGAQNSNSNPEHKGFSELAEI